MLRTTGSIAYGRLPGEDAPRRRDSVESLISLLRGRRFVVLTGAGCSTDSGIPDYRGPTGAARQRQPIGAGCTWTSTNAKGAMRAALSARGRPPGEMSTILQLHRATPRRSRTSQNDEPEREARTPSANTPPSSTSRSSTHWRRCSQDSPV